MNPSMATKKVAPAAKFKQDVMNAVYDIPGADKIQMQGKSGVKFKISFFNRFGQTDQTQIDSTRKAFDARGFDGDIKVTQQYGSRTGDSYWVITVSNITKKGGQ